MREIKFRAWDKKNKIMSLVNFPKDGLDDYLRYSDLEWMQYTGLKDKNGTGLKDKNGKEICEGDIVEITDTFDTYNVAIKWIDESCRWGFDVNDPEEYGYLNEWTMEVIGNIYENPELLKEDN